MVTLASPAGPEHPWLHHDLSRCWPATGSHQRMQEGDSAEVYTILKAPSSVWSLAVIHRYWHNLTLCFPLSHFRYYCGLSCALLHSEFQPWSLRTAASPPAYVVASPWLTAHTACFLLGREGLWLNGKLKDGKWLHYLKSSVCSTFLWGLGGWELEAKSLGPVDKTHHQVKKFDYFLNVVQPKTPPAFAPGMAMRRRIHCHNHGNNSTVKASQS